PSTPAPDTRSLHDALPICPHPLVGRAVGMVDDEEGDAADLRRGGEADDHLALAVRTDPLVDPALLAGLALGFERLEDTFVALGVDRKSTRLNSSHVKISYA